MQTDNITTREKAIDFWDNTISDAVERVEWKFKLTYKYFGDVDYLSLSDSHIEQIYLAQHPHETKKEQGKEVIEGLEDDRRFYVPLIKELEAMKRRFYMDICRAYNAGKLNAIEMVAEGKNNGGAPVSFQSSHQYFIGEFPEFKTNVP